MSEFPIGQPAEGWCEAERKAPGYTRTRAYKQKEYYHRNKDELKRRREEKMAKEAGIPVSKKAKPIYGNVALLFGASAKAPPSESRHDLPEQEESDCITPPPAAPEESEPITLKRV